MKRVFFGMLMGLQALSAMHSRVEFEVRQGRREPPYRERHPRGDWYGPGLYWGVWFSNEGDYHRWREEHPHFWEDSDAYYYYPSRRAPRYYRHR